MPDWKSIEARDRPDLMEPTPGRPQGRATAHAVEKALGANIPRVFAKPRAGG